MIHEAKNLLNELPADLSEERFTTLCEADGLRIERIVSQGQTSPPWFWYDQDRSEWVVVLQGEALIEFDDGQTVRLRPGSHLEIPAHQKHRVAWTDPNGPTVWLAVHFAADAARRGQ
ncbi:MAG: cupin domain-containing protein [Thermoguttaceae bacterium]